MAVSLFLTLPADAFGVAFAGQQGSATVAPGASRALVNCFNHPVANQVRRGQVGGGAKAAAATAPTNCDHLYQYQGLIGSF